MSPLLMPFPYLSRIVLKGRCPYDLLPAGVAGIERIARIASWLLFVVEDIRFLCRVESLTQVHGVCRGHSVRWTQNLSALYETVSPEDPPVIFVEVRVRMHPLCTGRTSGACNAEVFKKAKGWLQHRPYLSFPYCRE